MSYNMPSQTTHLKLHSEIWWAMAVGGLAHFGLSVIIVVLGPVAMWKLGEFASNALSWHLQKRNGPTRVVIDGGEIALWTHRNGRVDTCRLS